MTTTNQEVPIRLFSSRLLVKPCKELEVTPGGIVIPEAARKSGLDSAQRATVVAMGPGMLKKDGTRWPMPDCKLGDTVLMGTYAGSEIQIDQENYMIVRDDDIIAVVEP